MILILASLLLAQGEPAVGKQAALRPQFKLKGGKEFWAGTAFVARDKKDAPPVILTALHLFGPDGGLPKPIPSARLGAEVVDVRLSAIEFLDIKAVGGASLISNGKPYTEKLDVSGDVAAFALKEGTPDVLLLAEADPKKGAAVWILGDEFEGKPPRMRLWPGKVDEAMPQGIEIVLADKVNLRGFSGAPVVDAAGGVVGMVSCIGEKSARLVPVSAIRRLLGRK